MILHIVTTTSSTFTIFHHVIYAPLFFVEKLGNNNNFREEFVKPSFLLYTFLVLLILRC
jgi:hypothetical protein